MYKSEYLIENQNEIIYIHDKEVNNISECNLLHDMINPHKRAKNINRYYSTIIHGCMNTRKNMEKFKNFWNILDSGFSSTIVMVSLVRKLRPQKDAVMQWHTKAKNITTNYNVNVDFTLPILSATNVVTWKYHVDKSAKARYDMILGRYLLIEL